MEPSQNPQPKNIAEAWAGYSKLCLPSSVSKIQYTETKKAFYAGCFSYLSMVVDAASEDSEDDSLERCHALFKQAQAEMDSMMNSLTPHKNN